MSDGAAECTAVVVNWQGERFLRACVESLLAQEGVRLEILVVDNGSRDASVELLSAFPPRVRVIRNQSNLGFAAGCNQGIRASSAPYIALLNNDAVADPGWIAEMCAAMERDSRVGSCASRVRSLSAPGLIDTAGHVLYGDGLTRGRGRLQSDGAEFERSAEVFCPSGSAALLRRTMLDDVGLFDESFFAYCEDADLGFRARLRGWTCQYVPTAIAHHHYSASGGAYSAWKAYLVERNRIWLAVKNLPRTPLAKSVAYSLLRYAWQAYGLLRRRGAAARFAESQSAASLPAILARSYQDALKGMRPMWTARAQIQGSRRVSDADVAEWFRRFGIGPRQLALMD